jgi:hypothetical protein
MKSRTINPDLLPILTDTVDGSPIDLPLLTEAVERRRADTSVLSLTDLQCQQLAKQLFPRLEEALRDAVGSRSAARWEKSMQEVRSALPQLIRKSVQKPK